MAQGPMEPSGRGMEGSDHPPSGPLVSWQASPTSTPGDSSSGSNSNKEEGPLAHTVTATALRKMLMSPSQDLYSQLW